MKRCLLWAGLILVSPMLLVLLVVYIVCFTVYKVSLGYLLKVAFITKYRSSGKRGVLVYSNSPNWQQHIEDKWLPSLRESLVVINWSERDIYAQHPTLAWRVFRHWSDEYEFNPMVLVLRGLGPIKEFRFHKAFLDHKHGKSAMLAQIESELFTYIKR